MSNQFLSPKLKWCLALYFALWVVLPFMLSSSYPLDVPEGIYWGREWQWGYYKHPPLSSWVLYSFYTVFGHIGPYLLSQCTIALTLWLVYRFGTHLMSRERAAVSAFLLMGVFYYTWPSLEFNHNIAQMPVWVALVYAFYLATRQNLWRYWLLFGLLAGAGMLVKYSVAILLITMVLYSFITPYRRLWLTPKPWVALLLASVVFSPNVVWLVEHHWLPFTYAEGRAEEAESHSGRLAALGFLLTQLLNHLPLLLILVGTRTRLRIPTLKTWDDNTRFLLFMGLAPVLLLVFLGIMFGVGLRDMWGMPMWGLSGLIAVRLIPDEVFARKAVGLVKGSFIWLAIATLLMAVYVQFGAQIRHKPSRMDWPQSAIAQHVDAQWRQLSLCRLDNVSGANWQAILAASYSQFAPSVMIAGNPAYTPWMSQARLRAGGSMYLWPDGDHPRVPLLDGLAEDSNMVVHEGVWSIAWPKLPEKTPLLLHWRAYVPKACVRVAAQ
ncbi:glycosyltransferase family 39 protein [Snodgrassella sp. CFCC 13594]|uniref:glycosyltransferase family 39 protein n=1 Tax=Snodgrassella sp. CFCC 13594 TaxID=1775559 RepID=UPI000A8FA986|nr:glycosyltransferase family 39 protein [Snodgrassella sp. CFCC 13594]